MIPLALNGNIVLPAIFSDHMVLQQRSDVTIWGWGKPLETVTVKAGWLETPLKTVVDNQANWQIKINTPEAGGPYTIHIHGYNHIVLQDVMIGEVWLCSGQSNMEWTARMGIDNAEKEVAHASFPDIRLIIVDHRSALTPQVDISTNGWTSCSPETMFDFSAVAYFFARRVQQELNVPIGLINSSWGGTPAEAWTSLEHCKNPASIIDAAKALPDVPWGPEEPGCIYNAMVAPLTKFQIAGAIWYQGEANVDNALHYHNVFPEMMISWRNAWGYEFPFYFTQIAPYEGYANEAGVFIRDAQGRSLQIPFTGMIVTSDIGNITDIHPTNKQDVGYRLASLALNRTYHMKTGLDSGPIYKSREVNGDKIIIHFYHAEGLYAKDDPLTYFEIAGKDHKFHPATASIVQNTVEVHSPLVMEPVAVRYAWSNAAEPNLFNKAHLPTSCFRTDNWQLAARN